MCLQLVICSVWQLFGVAAVLAGSGEVGESKGSVKIKDGLVCCTLNGVELDCCGCSTVIGCCCKAAMRVAVVRTGVLVLWVLSGAAATRICGIQAWRALFYNVTVISAARSTIHASLWFCTWAEQIALFCGYSAVFLSISSVCVPLLGL
jgi:hypothetical protein